MTRRIRSLDVRYAYPGVLGVPQPVPVTYLGINVTYNGEIVTYNDPGEKIRG